MYAHEKERLITPQLLELAKAAAVRRLCDYNAQCRRRFHNYAMRKYRCKHSQIRFVNRLPAVRRAYLAELHENTLGETSGREIRINGAVPFTFPVLVSTLIHEAQHNWCIVRGRCMGVHPEHYCIAALGEDESHFSN